MADASCNAWTARAPAATPVTGSAIALGPVTAFERQWRWLIACLLVADSLAIWIGLTLAYKLRMTSGLLGLYAAPYDPGQYEVFALISIPLWLLIFVIVGLYHRDHLLGGLIEYQQAFLGCTSGVVALIVLPFFWRDYAMLSRGWLTLAWLLTLSLVLIERFAIRRAVYRGRKAYGWLTSRVLIVGANDQGVAMASQWLTSPTSGMQVVGFLDDFKPLGMPVVDGLRVIGRPTALDQVARAVNAQEVVVVPTAVGWETFEKLVGGAPGSANYTLRFSPGFYEVLTTGVAVTNKTFVPLFTVNEARLVGGDATLKMVFDYGLGIILLLCSLPVMGVIALCLKIVAPSNAVLERFATIGQQGTTFTMVKFRVCHQVEGRKRVKTAWIEHLLYRTGLDKLPQLFNVLANQMSLVGPRPQVIGTSEVDPRTMRNLQTVKPGITGMWADARCAYNQCDEATNELRYVRSWTLWLDMQILYQSFNSWIYSGRWPGRVRDERNLSQVAMAPDRAISETTRRIPRPRWGHQPESF